jgi:hypothetical protein
LVPVAVEGVGSKREEEVAVDSKLVVVEEEPYT